MYSSKILRHLLIIVLLGTVVGMFAITSCGGSSPAVLKKNTTSLVVVHSPHLDPLMNYLAKGFHASPYAVLADGSKIDLRLISEPSLEASKKISSGKLKVHAWLAPSTSLINYTNANLKNLGPKQTDCVQIFATPTIVATTKKNTSKLKAKGNSFSWSKLFDEQITNENAANRLTFNHAAPFASGTGLAALIQLAYVSLGYPSTLRNEDLSTPRALSKLEKFEKLASGYGYFDRALLNQVAWARNDKVHYTITSEQALAVYNLNRIKNGLEPLLALYPEEGSYWVDYNMCVSDADWLSPAHRKAIQQLNSFLTTEQSQTAAVSFGFRPSGGAVALVPPLTPEYGIDVSKGKTALLPVTGELVGTLLNRWPDLLKPAAILFVMDLSGSMEGPSLRVGKTSFRNTIASTSWRDLKGLMSFTTTTKIHSDFITDSATIIPILDSLQAQGGSAVYDAILKASQLITKDSLRDYRKTIVIFTDGGDKNSDSPLKRLIDNTKDIFNRNNVNLIIVAIGHEGDFSDLALVADAANGVFIHTSYDDAALAFSKIRSML